MKNLMTKFLISVILISSVFVIGAFAQKNGTQKREVTIYLLREPEENEEYDPNNPLSIYPVKRQVNADNPIVGAMKALVKGETKAEEQRKYHSSTFGIKFLSLSLKKGVLTTRFTMPKTASFSGDLSPDIFQEAVRKTGIQFKEVKKVIVSLDGATNFGGEDANESRPPKNNKTKH